MGFFDFLTNGLMADEAWENKEKKVKGKPQAQRSWQGVEWYACPGCGESLNGGLFGLGSCKCDKDLGRPRKWYE